jgi:hypothetical protein
LSINSARIGGGIASHIKSSVGGGGEADQRLDPFGPRFGQQQRDPAAHRRADDDLGPLGQRIERGQGVGEPGADATVGEFPVRFAVARIVETQAGLAARPGECLDRHRLRSGHVGHEPGAEDDPGRLAGNPAIGDTGSAGAGV